MRVLLAERSTVTARFIANALRLEGLAVDVVRTVAQTRVMRDDVDYDGLLLDRELPDGDSLDLVRELRAEGDTVAVVLMSDRGGADDRIEGLEDGADEYLAKPVDVKELVLRVRKVLLAVTTAKREVIPPPEVVGRVSLARHLQAVEVDGEPVKLSSTQYCLVEYLFTNRDREISAEELLAECWDRNLPPEGNPLPPQITRVRNAMRGALKLMSVRRHTYAVTVEGEDEVEGGSDRGQK